MIFRTYGRRSRDLTGSYSGTDSFADGVSDSSSQECPQDVYDFTFPSQESTRCQWSDPYGFNSSQDPRELTLLPSRKGGDCDDGVWKSKKAKVIDVDLETYGSSSSQELKELGGLQIIDGEFQNAKKLKKVNPDPYEYNSDVEEIVVRPQRKGRENKVFDFSENGDLWKSNKSKNVDSDSFMLNSSQELNDLRIPQSRKRGVPLDLAGVSGKSKKKDRGENGGLQKKMKKKKKMKLKEPEPDYVELTTTLMETQEGGEMMEHVDEVNFALDGLKKGQPARVRRASLLSLLSICGTVQKRRLLRVHGMAKTILDAVLGLSFDDTPSNLAAAALFYILTSDSQDDHRLDSPSCIRFLMKLLKPLSSTAAKEEAQPIGSKLLGLSKNAGFFQESAKGTDASSTAVMLKVREILVNCKEMKPRENSDDVAEEPELNPKWISLLTMEKACLSSISIEEASGSLRKSAGNFKEKLREFGGLDAVFDLARKCHSVMEEWLEKSATFALDLKDISGLESLALLLKCLKIMENATFLSNDNQCHLLRMKANFDGKQAPRSFTRLVLSVIKILSGVSLLRSSSGSSQDEKLRCISCGTSYSGGLCSMVSSSQKSFNQCDQCFIYGQPGSLSADSQLLKLRVESSQAGSCSGTSWNINNDDSELEFGPGKRQITSTKDGDTEDIGDPFAFDEDDFVPSKWEMLPGSVKKPLSQDSRASLSGYKDESHSILTSRQQESDNTENHHSQATSCSSAAGEVVSNLLADCLLTAVKVLMNLTNDNPEGCQQIATCGGIEILSSLIAAHFSSFSLSSPQSNDVRESSLLSISGTGINQRNNITLTDQELDFLVAILGLLVNLVEKDACNRSRLAATIVPLPNLEGLDLEDQSGVISLLCSIFLANQGTGEAGGEENCLSWEDEEAISQGEKEAEKMIVEAYAALLLAFLSTESKSVRDAIAECLPNHSLKILVPVLERFVEFHMTLNMISPETHTAVLEVIESCRIP